MPRCCYFILNGGGRLKDKRQEHVFDEDCKWDRACMSMVCQHVCDIEMCLLPRMSSQKKTNQDVIQYLTVLLDTYGPIVLVHLTCDICQFSAICFGFVALHLTCFYGQELLIWVGWTCIILMQIGVLQIWMKQKQNFVHRSSAWDNWWVRDGLLWAPCGAVLRDLTMQHALEIFGRLYIPRENNSVYG